jgi:hypothetical protein
MKYMAANCEGNQRPLRAVELRKKNQIKKQEQYHKLIKQKIGMELLMKRQVLSSTVHILLSFLCTVCLELYSFRRPSVWATWLLFSPKIFQNV